MFGLMRTKRCGLTAGQRAERRLHYCGTCKTLSSLYGQKSRFLLDHDTVFLAEILTAMSEEKPDFGGALQSYNCLARPKSAGEMPLELQFAATANVVLADFKTNDHVADSKNPAWLLVRKVFDKSFRRATRQLKNWDFPLAELKSLPQMQAEREAEKFAEPSARNLFRFAEPTARATALFFAHGAKLAGRENLQNEMRRLGAAFGETIYLLDAFEDYERDATRGEFNAIRAAFDLQERKLPNSVRRKIENLLQQKEREMVEALEKLPIDAEQSRLFAARFRDNLSRYFKKTLPVVARKACRTKSKSLTERFSSAVERSRKLSANSAWWQLPFAFASVLLIAFLAPVQAREARSWRECSELGFNLMFLGAASSAVLASPKAVLLENIDESSKKNRRKRKQNDDGRYNRCDDCFGCCECCSVFRCKGKCCQECDRCDCCDCNCSCD